MARNRQLEEMPEQFQDRLSWLEDHMEGIASLMYKNGLERQCFGAQFYEVQDKLAALIGLPDNYSEFIELEMDPRVILE